MARNSLSPTLDLAMTLSVGIGLVLLVAAGITAAMDLSAKADRTYNGTTRSTSGSAHTGSSPPLPSPGSPGTSLGGAG